MGSALACEKISEKGCDRRGRPQAENKERGGANVPRCPQPGTLARLGAVAPVENTRPLDRPEHYGLKGFGAPGLRRAGRGAERSRGFSNFSNPRLLDLDPRQRRPDSRKGAPCASICGLPT